MDPWLIATNFAVCNAIYDADRIDAPFWSAERAGTRLSALAAASYYASDPRTQAFAPLALALHFGYTRAKPGLAPAKPFVVAACWTAVVYVLPLLKAPPGVILHVEPCTPAALFLGIAALSHVADLYDVEEDRAAGVVTAVHLGTDGARSYAIALGLAAALFDSLSPHPFTFYTTLQLSVLAGLLTDARVVAAAYVAFLVCYVREHDLELVTALLQSTETTHKLAISAAVDTTKGALALPDPWRPFVVETVIQLINAGDAMGSALLHTYEDLIRARLH